MSQVQPETCIPGEPRDPPFDVSEVDEWVPAFPTEQVRGLKAHGNASDWGANRSAAR
jgi:hypothetical protein